MEGDITIIVKLTVRIMFNTIQASISTGIPSTCYLAPPVNSCLKCQAHLHVHNEPVRVICYTPDGPLIALKLTLRCKGCGLNYRYDQYGSPSNGGYRYYSQSRPLVQASQVCYVHRTTCEQWITSRSVHMNTINFIVMILFSNFAVTMLG